MRLIAYTRVSTAEQARKGFGLAAQSEALRARGVAEGWELVDISDEGHSARSVKRPGYQEALRMLRAGEVDGIAVAKLDRLSRSLVDFSRFMEEAAAKGWRVVALDLGVDTATSSGRLVANIMASIAEWERERISERTAEGMAAARAAGKQVGYPGVAPEVRLRVHGMRARGMSLGSIAAALDAEGIPTAQGAPGWHKSSVASVLRRR